MIDDKYLKDNGIISVKIITEGMSAPVILITWADGDSSRLVMSKINFNDVDQCLNEEVKLHNAKFRKQKIEKIINNLNGIQN
jgi:hypothetical protein